ncbi:MAG: DUF1566 domain-containing protein [Methylococcaceae bacterium]|nr:DUF1566 domain-containing protein [Methylococcaceae bacterium]
MAKYCLAKITFVALFVVGLLQFTIFSRPSTFVDTRTALIWQRCSAGMRDNMGDCAGVAGLYDWQQALGYCAQLKGQGWHLPDRNELISLVDWQKRTPAVPDALRANTKNNVYWTATSSEEEPNKAYYVSMFSGFSYPNKKIIQGFVRCVQSLP